MPAFERVLRAFFEADLRADLRADLTLREPRALPAFERVLRTFFEADLRTEAALAARLTGEGRSSLRASRKAAILASRMAIADLDELARALWTLGPAERRLRAERALAIPALLPVCLLYWRTSGATPIKS